MDQSQEILLGHAIFTSSEYGYHGYRRIAHSISNKKSATEFYIFSHEICHPNYRHSLTVDVDNLWTCKQISLAVADASADVNLADADNLRMHISSIRTPLIHK